MELVILGNPITKKNSQQIIVNPRTHRPMIIPSKNYKKYESYALKVLKPLTHPISYPVTVKCLYYMQTRGRCDLVNLEEATLDILVRAHILSDDNFKVVVSMDGSRVLYDKENPRVEISIKEYLNESEEF